MVARSGSAAPVDAYRRLTLPGIMSQVQTTHHADTHAVVDDHLKTAQALEARELVAVDWTIGARHARGEAAHRRAIEEAGGRL
jgi:hypothetical protein